MEKKLFKNLVVTGFIKSLTLSVTGLIDCVLAVRALLLYLPSVPFIALNTSFISCLQALGRKGASISFAGADDVSYNSSMNLNNVCIRIDREA